jgi:hypothetical protein
MKRLIFLPILFLLPSLCFGVDASSIPQQITLSVDADLIAFVKTTIWLGGIFLAIGGFLLTIYALIGVAFFGFDVRKARGSLNDVQNEVREKLNELHKDYEVLKDLKGKLGELGAKLQEDIESLQDLKEKREELDAKPQEGTKPSASVHGRMNFRDAAPTVCPPASIAGTRSNIDLIREIIASSNYEWTTIGRIMKKTGLSHDEILQEARSAPDIIIGYGRQTNDNLFKFDPIKSVLRPTLRDMYPLPESREAIEHGCKCTIAKNANGISILDQDGKQLYVIEKGCPIHG